MSTHAYVPSGIQHLYVTVYKRTNAKDRITHLAEVTDQIAGYKSRGQGRVLYTLYIRIYLLFDFNYINVYSKINNQLGLPPAAETRKM